METIKILHLFPRLLSLYGEYGNVTVLAQALERNGYKVEICAYETAGGAFPADADFVYVGSGTEANLLEAIRRLTPQRGAVRACIEGGTPWLATGNAMSLFGAELRWNGDTIEALGVFPYTTAMDQKTRYLGDALTAADNPCGAPMVGFINTACVYSGIDAPLFSLRLGASLGNDKRSAAEGIVRGSFCGTQLIGPALVKNPAFLAFVFHAVTGETLTVPEDSAGRKAYATAVEELTKRLAKA